MRRTVPPSAEIEAQIDQLLAVGVFKSTPCAAACCAGAALDLAADR